MRKILSNLNKYLYVFIGGKCTHVHIQVGELAGFEHCANKYLFLCPISSNNAKMSVVDIILNIKINTPNASAFQLQSVHLQQKIPQYSHCAFFSNRARGILKCATNINIYKYKTRYIFNVPFKAYFAQLLVGLGRVCRSPSMSTCYGQDRLALHGRSRDFFRFAIFLLYAGDSRWQLRCCPPCQCFNLSQAEAQGKHLKYNGNTPCSVAVSPREQCKNVF